MDLIYLLIPILNTSSFTQARIQKRFMGWGGGESASLNLLCYL
jgi:hypothetical protein